MATSKATYQTGVKCGNWFEDVKGAERAVYAMSQRPTWGISETTERYQNRYADLAPSAPGPPPTDAISGNLVFAHGPNIIDQTMPPDQYLSVAQAVLKGYKPHDAAVVTKVLTGSNNRTELIASKARMRAAGVDAWDPTSIQRAALPSIQRTVAWTGAPQIPVEGLGARPADMSASFAVRSASDAATAAAMGVASPASHARHGGFTKTFRTLYGEGCVTKSGL